MINLEKNNLQRLEDCIKELVPEIMELKPGCKIRWCQLIGTVAGFDICRCKWVFYNESNNIVPFDETPETGEILGRPITLEDVLMVIQKKELNMEREFERVCLITCDEELDNGIIEIAQLEWKGIKAGTEIKWQLGKPLSLQSEETITNLLKIFEV